MVNRIDPVQDEAQAFPTEDGEAMHDAHILILAAGSSRRMRGSDKLMEPVDAAPQIARITRVALATGAPVTVVLPPDRPQRRAALAGTRARVVIADAADEGMAESVKAGLTALPPQAAVMLLLADLPEITTEDLRQMLSAWRATPQLILRAMSAEGEPGHPVCFPAWTRPDLETLRGDEGARAVLRHHAGRMRMFALPGNHATTDLDTPEDWRDWRASRRENALRPPSEPSPHNP
ncbi:MAG: nucleotidyltransferase family protein [Paracoccaceae bacterium]